MLQFSLKLLALRTLVQGQRIKHLNPVVIRGGPMVEYRRS